MKTTAAIVVASIVLATAYGVVFSIFYPLVTITGSILATFAFAGLATSLIFAGLWKAVRK